MSRLAEELVAPAGRERDVAEWRLCADVCSRLGDYAPVDFRMGHEAGWSHEEQQGIGMLLAKRHMDTDDLRGVVANFIGPGSETTFGKWRVAVSSFEESEAAKLRTLAWILSVLNRLRELPDAKPEHIDPLVNKLADFLRTAWRARLDKVPIGRDASGWAARGTRRYDLLPKSWRFV